MELIALPLLALFYLIATPFLLLDKNENIAIGKGKWLLVIVSILAGLGIAYCIIGLMLYTLSWLPGLDMIENSGLILVSQLLIFSIRYKQTRRGIYGQFVLRLCLMLCMITLVYLLPFQKAAAIPL